MTKLKDLTGQKFNRLLVLERTYEGVKTKQARWKCLCSCGTFKNVDSYSLTRNQTKSCGCLQRDNRTNRDTSSFTKHGMYNTRTYHTWEGMKQRCLNPNATRYPSYGGVGVLLCKEWYDFDGFLKDMGERPEGKTLDRINPFGNYEPSNCRWATYKEQVHNRRRNHVVPEEVTPLC